MKKNLIFLFLLLSFQFTFAQTEGHRDVLNLKGMWLFSLDSLNTGEAQRFYGKTLKEQVQLPGTTDTNKKGYLNTDKTETTHLSRLYKYEGVAWYSKDVEVSEHWKDKQIILNLERTRPTKVWVDNHYIGQNQTISASQQYDLSKWLKPGKHKITIRVDNGESIPQQIRSSSHSCTESTQTNWNGIIGNIELKALNQLNIKSLQIYPDAQNHLVKVKVIISDSTLINNGQKFSLSASAFNTNSKHIVPQKSYSLQEGIGTYEFTYSLGGGALEWSEFDPALYHLEATIDGIDSKIVDFGLRQFTTQGNHFTINGTKTFLRGKHDACVFPLTAHTPMDVETWRNYFRTLKEYGINHCRFHSWCPPEACFIAADLEGVYLQPELPIWGMLENREQELLSFLKNDGDLIQNEYGNHASFVMFALGNELSGDEATMKDLVEGFRKIDNRHLYAFGSNNFLGYKGYFPEEDFLVTCRIGGGEKFETHTRGSFSFADAEDGGLINHTYPNSEIDFSKTMQKSSIPVISHETGQFQVYPNYEEMKKYTGVLAPWNFEVFRQRLDKAGMSEQASDFFKASGALSALLYKADVEMCLRTENLGGFQLLDLQDYPGQGSAYVGILDAFMDNKGLISAENWTQFCNEIVPLFVTDKFCFRSNDSLVGTIKIANYSNKDLTSKSLKWTLTKPNGETFAQNIVSNIPKGSGLIEITDINQSLSDITEANKLILTLSIEETSFKNTYPLWIYPTERKEIPSSNILLAESITEDLLNKLEQGKKVLLIPDKNKYAQSTVGGLFQTDYWNYRMFKTICDKIEKPASPGTLGLLIDSDHKLFNHFPTEFHSDWQWFPIVKESSPLIMDRMPRGYKPIVQVIDNVERNHRLGLVFEFKVGKGSLLVCMANLDDVLDKPEALRFYNSLITYVNSASFNPTTNISKDDLNNLFSGDAISDKIDRLDNISY